MSWWAVVVTKTPDFVLAACAVILILWLGSLFRMFWEWRNVRRVCESFASIFDGTPAIPASERRGGLALDSFNRFEHRAKALPRPEAGIWWDRVADGVIRRRVQGRASDSIFLERHSSTLLTEEFAIGPLYNGAMYHALPGLITGIGLAVTFTAILVALWDVTLDTRNTIEPVKGMEGLINGLSGKFLSSVVALFCAVVFTLAERLCGRDLENRLKLALLNLSRAIPVLSLGQLLTEIQEVGMKQATSLSNISSDIVDRFVNVFRDDLAPGLATGLSAEMVQKLDPTLMQMTETLGDLKRAIEKLEQQKQDSIQGELKGLLGGLQTALEESLGEMSRSFHESLSGSARAEFGNVQGALQSTTTLLEGMNSHFGELQASLLRVIEKAESTTQDQLQSSREQAEAMTSLMNGLMTQIHKASTTNVQAISAQLTMVMEDLGRKVGGLSEDMTNTMRDFVVSSHDAAGKVIEHAGSWSQASAQRLDGVLSSIEARSIDFEKAGRSLLDAQATLANTVSQNERALVAFQKAGGEVATYSVALAGQSQDARTLSEQNRQVVDRLRDVSERLKQGLIEHQGLMKAHDGVLTKYDTSFEDLEKRLQGVLHTVLDGLSKYSATSEKNFRAIVSMTNDTVPKITNVLQSQTDELQEVLEGLTETLEKSLKRLQR